MALPKVGKTSGIASPSKADKGSDQGIGPFGWDGALAELRAPGSTSLNFAYAAVERHVAHGAGDRVALRWLGRRNTRRDITYAELSELSGRTASVLRGLGLRPGDTVAVLLGRVPDFYGAALGAWKAGGVFCPLYSAYGPGPVKARLELGRARVLIAADGLYARKVAGQRAQLPALEHVLLVGEDGGPAELHEGCLDLRALLAEADPDAPIASTGLEDPAFLHFTSGTTGTPKGALHPHRAVLSHLVTGRQVFGLGPDDVFWCTADPGWVTSTAYGIVTPLVCGCTLVVDEAELEPRRWYGILRDEAVTAWYTTPTAIRMMMRYGAALARTYRQNALRVAASVGEPLNAEAVRWGEKALGVPFFDTWWQTETGAISIANLPGARRPGSMGKALPAILAAVVRRDCDSGALTVVEEPDTAGELAIRADWPSLLSGYVGGDARFAASFVDGWYLTGDLVKRDADGFFWFIGRSDDMIKSGAHQIGPFEVESMLMDHPAVGEIGVVGKSDLLLREVPVAFVTVNPGFEAGEALRAELLSFARQELGAVMAPREIAFIDAMPKTSSGKIMRRLLKARAMGEPEETEPVIQLCPGRFDDE